MTTGPGYLLCQSDARLIPLPDRSVHMVVTSPPYWGLRDYGTAAWEGGDDPACDHKVEVDADRKRRDVGRVQIDGFHGSTIETELATPQFRSRCRKCGARRIDRQIGLEASPDAFVATMVKVFREVKRVLRDDGTVWLNLGDSYAASGPTGGNGKQHTNLGSHGVTSRSAPPGLKPKDLIGVPWRVALALQADGWTLRSEIIWAKNNPMPESVSDRPTKSHEQLFLLAKSNTTQFWTHRDHAGTRTQPPPDYRWVHEDTGEERADEPPGWREKGSPWERVNLWRGRDYYFDTEAVREAAEYGRRDWNGQPHLKGGDITKRHNGTTTGADPSAGRNLRSVWTIPTESWPGAHFATFPRKLVEPCIKAGTSEHGCCPKCGAGWVRQTTVEYVKSPVHGKGSVIGRHYETGANNFDGAEMPRLNRQTSTLAWRPSCQCFPADIPLSQIREAWPVPATVLDPFAGSGTTLVVANALGRHGIGLDLSREYLVGQAQRRLERPHAKPQRPARVEPALPLFQEEE